MFSSWQIAYARDSSSSTRSDRKERDTWAKWGLLKYDRQPLFIFRRRLGKGGGAKISDNFPYVFPEGLEEILLSYVAPVIPIEETEEALDKGLGK